jgi:hypothetical protein
MFNGTMIEELLQIVERAEQHARVIETKATAAKPEFMPGFLYEMQQQQGWYGVA